MVDEHVPPVTVAEHLEVAPVLVDVQHDAHILLVEGLLDTRDRRHVRDRERAILQEHPGTRCAAREDEDRVTLAEFDERRVPLTDLVGVDGAVGEVHGDAVTAAFERWERAKLPFDRLDHAASPGRAPDEPNGLLRIREERHLRHANRRAGVRGAY